MTSTYARVITRRPSACSFLSQAAIMAQQTMALHTELQRP